jgi:hypothetical protein
MISLAGRVASPAIHSSANPSTAKCSSTGSGDPELVTMLSGCPSPSTTIFGPPSIW